MGALDTAVRQGKALYVGISSYNSARTREAAAILQRLGTPCVIHQPSYSMINRWVEDGRTARYARRRRASAASPSPRSRRGLLTNKYLKGVPQDSRAAAGKSLDPRHAQRTPTSSACASSTRSPSGAARPSRRWRSRGCCAAAASTSALIGASRPEQVVDAVGALKNLEFSTEELAEIDRYAVEGDVNLWKDSAELG